MSLAKLLMPPPLEFLANFISIFAFFDVTLALERINGMVLFHLLVLGSLIFGIPLFLVYGLYTSTLWTTFNRSHRALCARILLKAIKLPMIAYIDLGVLNLWLSGFVAKLVLWPLVSSLARPPTCSHAVCWLETLSDTNYFWSPLFKLIAFLVDPTGLTLLQANVSHMKLNFVIGQDIVDKVLSRRARSHMRTRSSAFEEAGARLRYCNMILQCPDQMAGTLRDLHIKDHPHRFLFLQEMDVVYGMTASKLDTETRSLDDNFFRSGVLNTLWDIANDARYYDPQTPVSIFGRPILGKYIGLVYGVLASTCHELTSTLLSGAHISPAVVDLILRESQKLWRILWTPHVLTFLKLQSTSAYIAQLGSFRIVLMTMLSVVSKLELFYRRDDAFRSSIYMSHLALFCWMYEEDTINRSEALLVAQLSLAERPDTKTASDFAQQVVIKTGSSDLFLSRCAEGLKDIQDRDLQMYIKLPILMCQHPELRKGRDKLGIHWTMLDSMKRQLCMGEEKYTSCMIGSFLHAILDTFSNLYVPKDRQITLMGGFIPVFLRTVLLSAREEHIIAYVRPICNPGNRNICLSDYFRNIDQTQRMMQKEWHLTLSALDSLSPSDAPFRDKVIKIWLDFGLRFGFCFGTTRLTNEDVYMCPPAWKRCSSKDCVCHISGPGSAHLLRVCKGCWKAYYCCKKCQKRDWKNGGHRDLCRRSDSARV